MLQILREKAQGFMAWLIVLLVAAAFAFFGLTDYFSGQKQASTAAKINGEKIAWSSVENIYKRVAPQYGEQMGEKALKEQILKAMAQRTALLLEAKTLGFRVGDEQVAQLLLKIPVFQLDGQFSKEQYLKILGEAAYTDVGFRQELFQDILLGQLEQGIAHSSFTLNSELQSSVALLDQKRDFGYILIPAQKYQQGITIPVDQMKSYYEARKSNFVKPEQVVLEYVELSLEQLASQIKPSKEDVLAFYQEHQTAYTAPERVHARHILMTAPEKAEALLATVKQGADFEKLAKEVSEDEGSAKQGGDLGWFVRGQMVPAFEKAAFELQPGTIGGPIRTQFGYHLIQVVEHKDSEVRPFEQVQSLVEEQLKREKGEQLFAEKAEMFAKLAFEQTSSLIPLVEQLGLKIQETEPFSRGGNVGNNITTHPEVMKVAFSEALLKQGYNSEPIKLSEKVTAVFRLKKHEPTVQETYAEVEKKIKEILVAEQAKNKLKEMGEVIVKELRNGKKPDQVAKAQQLTWVEKSNVARMASDIDRQIVMAAFQIVPSETELKQPNAQGLVLPNNDYLILTLRKIHLGDVAKMDPTMQKSYRQGLAEISSQLEYALYTNQVFQDAKVEYTKDPS